MHLRRVFVSAWLLVLAVSVPAQQATLGSPERIADGVLLYRLADPQLLNPSGPVAVQALRIDPRKMRLEIGRGPGDEPPAETVETIVAGRPGAIAAINAGFFSLKTGRPTDLLKIDGKVVNGTSRPRAAVAILDRGGATRLLFDQIVVDRDKGPAVYKPLLGTSPRDWLRAPHAVSGAGLLILNGRALTDWGVERITGGFDTTRHPRTIIGTDAQGAIWLVTIDGRNPSLSLGMTFTELQGLSRRLGLRSVLNLDGGGSTTMWVDGRIVNHPSDPTGPRKVSDAILVVPR
jgi:exopolysaccharide biosynthesis protein